MEDLSLHILDIAENSIAAGAKNIEIRIVLDTYKDLLIIEIIDDGKGMNEEVVKNVTDPFYTTRTTRKVGLGLPMLEEAAKQAEGFLKIQSESGKGTHIRVDMKLGHIDRKPIGNMAETLVTIIAGNPNIDVRYVEKKENEEFIFDTKEIKSRILKINSPEILIFIKKYINENSILSNK